MTCSIQEILVASGSSMNEEAESGGFLKGPLNNEWLCLFVIFMSASSAHLKGRAKAFSSLNT